MTRNQAGRVLGAAVGAFFVASSASAAAAPLPNAEAPPPSRPWPTDPKDEAGPATSEKTARPDVRSSVPIVAHAYTAQGAPAKQVGGAGSMLALAAPGQDAVIGGGGTVWGSPLERLTLVLDAQRNAWGNFSPSGAAMWRLVGGRRGWAFGGLGKYKVEGFAGGPDKDEVEGEIELGALLSFLDGGWNLDLNAIGGHGTGEEGEMDVEGRARIGRDFGRYVRLGLDGEVRVRVAGPMYLPNGRTWDFAAGTQVMVASNSFFGAFTIGPATTGLVSKSVGVLGSLSVGGTI